MGRGRVMMRVVCLALCAAVVVANATIPQNLLNEWSQFKADDQFYDEMNSFLKTGTTQGGGDFEFKCETTCQLVQSDGGGAAARSAHSLLQTDEGVAAKRSQRRTCRNRFRTLSTARWTRFWRHKPQQPVVVTLNSSARQRASWSRRPLLLMLLLAMLAVRLPTRFCRRTQGLRTSAPPSRITLSLRLVCQLRPKPPRTATVFASTPP